MRGRLPLLLVLASALTFLASLYLPWQEAQPEVGGGSGVLGLLNLFAGGTEPANGWATGAGVAASLAALALVGFASAALLRPSMVDARFPAPIAVALCYFAIASLVLLHAGETGAHVQYRYAYGAYVGIFTAAFALLVAVVLRAPKITRRLNVAEGLTAATSVALLVAFLLPWAKPLGPTTASLPGVILPLVLMAAGGLCLLGSAASRFGSTLYAAAAIAILTGAGVHSIPERVGYGAWMAVGFVLALVASAAFARPPERPTRPSLAAGLTAAGAAVFVVALFLPWQKYCVPGGRPLGHGLGACITTSGWANAEPGAVAGALAMVLVLATIVTLWAARSIAELTLGIAILTAAIGGAVAHHPGNPGWSIDYGAYVGFAAVALLVLLVLAQIRSPKLERARVVERLVPLAASLAMLGAVALPLWSLELPLDWSEQTTVFVGWYAMAGLLLSIHLLRRWLESAGGASPRAEELMLLPLALLALTTLELVRERDAGVRWGGGILIGLCLLLTLFGWIEQRGGLQRLRVPGEIWRVDRLPEPES